jgi:two-component system, cell cycle sensor histidine kinase and response regulator CckA
VWAPTGKLLYSNQALRTMLGIEGAYDDCGGPQYRLHDRQGRVYPRERLPVSRALAEGAPVVVDDLVIHRADGGRVYVRAFANPVRDAAGAISHVVVTFTDITAEVQALAERAELEKHLAVAIHHAPVLLFMLDRNGVLTARDGALRAPLERGASMIGRSMFEAYKDHPTVPGNVRRALAGETVDYSIEVREFSLDVWIGPVRDAAGEVVGAIGVCTDVTERRRLQRRTIQDDRVRAMGTLAASVAHEINNPLTYVLLGIESARRELEQSLAELGATAPLPEEPRTAAAWRGVGRAREHLGPALAGTERIRQIARELQAFSRPDDERLAPLEVGTVVRSVLKLVRKEIEARARLVEDLGASPPVLANEARLVQVLVNMLINAWQALPEPDPARQVIGVRTGELDSQALIEIWDSGPGVPPARREEIFEPFVTTKGVGGGSGLGLFVCRNIITSLQGQISVHDAPGGGALFRVVLPATRPVAAVPAATPVPAAPIAAGRRRRLLIIDDDVLVAGALVAGFDPKLFEVRTVFDGQTGLELLLTDPDLDLAYCDLMMKGFNGIDLHDELERRAPALVAKVVFMTGGAFTLQGQAFVDRHRDRCLHKPFDIVADARQRLG